jgi:hypothetical protein
MFDQNILLNIWLMIGCLAEGFIHTPDRRSDV